MLCRSRLVWALLIYTWLAHAGAAWAQFGGNATPAQDPNVPKVRAEDEGLVIPRDPNPRPGNDRRVMVTDNRGKLVVGKVLVEAGDRTIAKLPNGRLTSVYTRDASTTDRPFVGATKEELTQEMTEKFPKFKIRTTKRFMYVYNTSELFYQGTSRILETMYPPMFEYWKRLKVPVQEPDTLLVVVMFSTDDEFQAYRQMSPGIVAYYNGINNQVVMYERSRLVEVSPDLAVKQAVAVVAHEGCHQIFANIGVQQRLSDWPMWISEGLPEYFSPTSVDKGVRWKGVGIVNDLRMKEIDGYLKENGKQVKPGQVSSETIKAERLTSTGYAFAWGLTHFLAERRKEKFAGFLREVVEQPPLVSLTSEQSEKLFQKHFGDDVPALERDLAKHLTGLPYVDPVETLTHYVCVIQGTLQSTVYVTYSVAAVKQLQAQAGASKFTVNTFPTRKAAIAARDAWLRSP